MSDKVRKETYRARAIPLIVAGLSDREVAREVGVTESTVARWRRQELGEVAAEALPPASVERVVATILPATSGGEAPKPPTPPTAEGGEWESLPGIEVPDDLGPLVKRLVTRGILAQEKILVVVAEPAFLLKQSAADVADLVRTLNNGTARMVEASERVLLSNNALEKARLELAKAQTEAQGGGA